MSVIINKDTRVVVQGITGNEGRFHTISMKNYGTNIVAGVTPGKGGRKLKAYRSMIRSRMLLANMEPILDFFCACSFR